jgi:polyhydroxyalkanoate synthesis regulator phasin
MKLSMFNSRLASVGLAGVIAVGVLGAGSVAMAQTPDGGSPTARETAARNHPKLKLGVAHLLKNSGVTREELNQGAQANMTLGQIIDQYGDISAAQAKANALQNLSDRLDEAVANGKLSQEQADRLEAAAPAMLDRLLNAVPGSHDGGGDHPRIRTIAKNALETVAGVLDTDVASITAQLKEGKTIAEIAGPETQAVIDALTEDANQAIEKAVADGKLPADKEDAAKEKAANAIERFVNEGRPHRGPRN